MMIMIITLEINSNQLLDATRFLLRKFIMIFSFDVRPLIVPFYKIEGLE